MQQLAQIDNDNISLLPSNSDHEAYIEQTLLGLSKSKQLAFLASICERMLPLYNNFVREESWGNLALIREALDKIWCYVLGEAIPEQEILDLREACKKVMPIDEDRFPTSYAYYARYTGAALDETLTYCYRSEAKLLVEVCSLPFDIIDQYIQDNGDDYPELDYNIPNLWDHVWNNNSMLLNEQKKQLSDLKALQEHQLDAQFIQQLKESSMNAPLITVQSSENDNSNYRMR